MFTHTKISGAIAIIFLLFMTSASANKWDRMIFEFEQHDMVSPPPQDATLFIGSSSIRLWPSLAKSFSPIPIINRGFGGAQTADVLEYMDRIVLPYKPKNIVFYCGGNDVSKGKSPQVAVTNLRKFIERVHKVLPETKIFVLSMKPTPSREAQWPKLQLANKARADYISQSKNVFYVDVAQSMFDTEGNIKKNIFIADNLHLNKVGYDHWVKILKERLLQGY
jgi:lysophospholipase L1-like esterase